MVDIIKEKICHTKGTMEKVGRPPMKKKKEKIMGAIFSRPKPPPPPPPVINKSQDVNNLVWT